MRLLCLAVMMVNPKVAVAMGKKMAVHLVLPRLKAQLSKRMGMPREGRGTASRTCKNRRATAVLGLRHSCPSLPLIHPIRVDRALGACDRVGRGRTTVKAGTRDRVGSSMGRAHTQDRAHTMAMVHKAAREDKEDKGGMEGMGAKAGMVVKTGVRAVGATVVMVVTVARSLGFTLQQRQHRSSLVTLVSNPRGQQS